MSTEPRINILKHTARLHLDRIKAHAWRSYIRLARNFPCSLRGFMHQQEALQTGHRPAH